MKNLMLNHAFQFVENVIFVVHSNNLRSQKAVQKIGGIYVESRTNEDGSVNFVYRISQQKYHA